LNRAAWDNRKEATAVPIYFLPIYRYFFMTVAALCAAFCPGVPEFLITNTDSAASQKTAGETGLQILNK